MLDTYRRQTQRFIRDAKQQWVDIGDIDEYINRARREVAMRTQCLRFLTEVSGSIITIQVTSGGSGYTNPTVTITPPDAPNGMLPYPAGAQATATAMITGGIITNISVNFGGAGYFQPQVTITDPHGHGATAVATTNPINVTQVQQEVYRFSDVPPVTTSAGVGPIYAIKGVDIIYSLYRYSIPLYPFTQYSAYVRQYASRYLFVPTVGCQYGWGTSGCLYLWPLPSQAYQLEFDSFHLPEPLVDDQSPEAIPQPWQDAIPYFAAHLCFLELQASNRAREMLDYYDTMVHRYSDYTRAGGRSINVYGRF